MSALGPSRRRPNAVVLASLFVAGCTFSGLGNYDVPRCDSPRAPATFADDPCRALDDTSTSSRDTCNVYQCDGASGRCVKRALDFDRDGVPSVACGGNDCDDQDARRTPGAIEICDGVDNDCDGRTDGDLVSALASRAVLAGDFDDPSLVVDGDDALGAASVAEGSGRCILAFRGDGTAIAPPCTFAPLAGVNPRAPQVRTITGSDVSFGSVSIGIDAACAEGQLRYANTKGGRVVRPCTSEGASLPAFRPYPGGLRGVTAAIRAPIGSRDDAASDCAALEAAPLDVVWIDRPAAAAEEGGPSIYAQRLALTSSRALRPPALLPFGDAVLLVAPSDDAVGVWSLRAPRADGSGESVVPLATAAALGALRDARATSAAIAEDGVESDVRTMAIVAAIGCPPAARLTMAIVRLVPPGPVLEVVDVVDVATRAHVVAPEIVWMKGRREWWVSWTERDASDASRLFVRRFSATGAPAADAHEGPRGARIALPRPATIAAASESVAYVDESGLGEAIFGCR